METTIEEVLSQREQLENQYDKTVREEIETFRIKAMAFLAGEIAEADFRPFRLKHGIYGQRQAGVQMVRCKIPGGLLTALQMGQLARVADEFAGGRGHLTTRQNIQYHFVPLHRVADLMHLLADVGLTNREACYNTVRNVTACAWASPATCRANSNSPSTAAVTRIASRAPSTMSASELRFATANAVSA